MSVKQSGYRLGHRIDEVSINGQDVSGSVFAIHLFEGIVDGFVEANFVLIDGASLIHELNFTQLNEISLEFSEVVGVEDELPRSYRKNFIINTVKNYGRSPEQDTDAFIIHALARPTIFNEKISISRSFKTKTISSIVSEMLDILEYTGNRDIVSTAYKRDYVAPRISPVDIIEMMRRYAVEPRGDTGDFMFFEDIDGVHFKPFSRIIDADPVRSYRLISSDIPGADTDFTLPTSSVVINKVVDVFQDFYEEAEDTRLCFVDIETGTQRIVDIDTRDGVINSDNTRSIDIPGSRDKVITMLDTGFYRFSKQQNIPVIGKNIVSRGRIHRMMASVQLPGENDLKPGSLIEFTHDNQSLNESNPVYTGVWMIERLKRILTSTGYVIHADIISDKIVGENSDSGFSVQFG